MEIGHRGAVRFVKANAIDQRQAQQALALQGCRPALAIGNAEKEYQMSLKATPKCEDIVKLQREAASLHSVTGSSLMRSLHAGRGSAISYIAGDHTD